MRSPTIVTLALVLASTPAAADGFLTLDRGDGESRGGVEASWAQLDPPFGESINVFRFDGHGHYVTAGGLGGYAAMSIAYGSNDAGSGTGIADAELGMLYVRRMNPTTELVFRGGVTLPTGNGDDDLEDFIVNAIGTTARITDTIQIIPEGTSLRLAVSPIIRSGQVFARFDGGLDINIDNAGSGEPDPVLRLNAGVGMDLGTVALTAELANSVSTDGDLDDQWANALAIGVRGRVGGVQPYGGLVVPIGDEYDGVDFVVTVGIDAVLGGGTPR